MLHLKSAALGLATLAALGLAAAPSAHAQATPVSVTAGSFNRDIVATATDTTAATQPFDTWNQWGFYTTTYPNGGTYSSQGLPASGAFTSLNSTGRYQLASYTSNNALEISTTASIPARDGLGTTYSFSNTGTMTLATPGKYSSIGVLNAAAYGASTVTVTLNYAGGTSTSSSLNVLDWFSGGTTSAITMRRIDVGTNTTGYNGAGTPDTSNTNEAYMYENYFTADPTKTLNSITFTDTADNTGGNANGHAVVGVFGLNGIAVAPEPGETAALMLGGLGLLGLIARKRRASA
jgi:hypothetical protein